MVAIVTVVVFCFHLAFKTKYGGNQVKRSLGGQFLDVGQACSVGLRQQEVVHLLLGNMFIPKGNFKPVKKEIEIDLVIEHAMKRRLLEKYLTNSYISNTSLLSPLDNSPNLVGEKFLVGVAPTPTLDGRLVV